ncbi:MATE family efflux transporter [Oceanispirochaeta crateris]|uniref:Multidrug-efflux transporter n=1 Tax=Oceanispirochaeta crateris TaxID=2518645 RepID=A0A5C1QL35_9SPIO|nr:MATE family efflux transporter [Oceanispirochaeta crateris]QEN08187.1 MATE family efflux transporter [Oceanispirochaeta crateris]
MDKKNKLEFMDVKKLIIKMSFPAIISMIVQALYNIIDSIFVARISEKALTALSLAFPIQLTLISIFVGLGVGLNSYISRKLGERNRDVAINTAEHGFFIGILLWLLFAFSSAFVPEMFFKLFTQDQEVIFYAVQYTKIIMIFSFGSIIAEVCMNILRATGDMISSMKIQLLGAITNIILDPILIFGFLFIPELGVKGAAIATALGQIISMFYALILVLGNQKFKLNIKKFHYSKLITIEILKVGIPVTFMQFLGSIMLSGINLILALFSGTAIAVFGVYYKLQSFIFMPVFGLTQGLMPILGFNYGAKKQERVMDTLKYGSIYAGIIMLLGTAIFQIFPRQLLILFNSSSEMERLGVGCLRIISSGFLFAGIVTVLSTYFQALGSAPVSLIVSLARQIIILLPVAYILSLFWGITGVWIAFPIAEITSFIIGLFFTVKVIKKSDKYYETDLLYA